MFPLWGLVLGLVVGFLMRGKLSNLEKLPFKHLWLIFAALVIQLLIFPTPWSSDPIIGGETDAYHYGSYIIIAIFFVINYRIYMLWPMAFGMVLNALVMTVNGIARFSQINKFEFLMPADPSALICSGNVRVAEILRDEGQYANIIRMDEFSHLNFLGDWICIPEGIPAASAISLGDVVLMLGLASLIALGMKGFPNTEETTSEKADSA